MILMLYICPSFWTSKYPWYFFGVILWICDIQSGFIIHECWRLIIHPCFFLWPPFLSFSNLLKQWLYSEWETDLISLSVHVEELMIIHPCFFSWCPFSSFSNLIFGSNDYRGSFEGVEVFLVFPSGAYTKPLLGHITVLRILILNHIIIIIESDLQTAQVFLDHEIGTDL